MHWGMGRGPCRFSWSQVSHFCLALWSINPASESQCPYFIPTSSPVLTGTGVWAEAACASAHSCFSWAQAGALGCWKAAGSLHGCAALACSHKWDCTQRFSPDLLKKCLCITGGINLRLEQLSRDYWGLVACHWVLPSCAISVHTTFCKQLFYSFLFSLCSDGYTAVTSHQPGKLGKLTTRHQAVPHHQQQEPFWERKTAADTPRSHTASHK